MSIMITEKHLHLKTPKRILLVISLCVISLSIVCLIKSIPTVHATSHGSYYAVGAQMYDNNGNPIVLVGANIESSFIYIKNYQAGKSPLLPYADPTFQVMNHDWHMNTLRLSISRAEYDLNKSTYLSQVNTVAKDANAHGLFVILNLHDDAKSGSLFTSDTPTELDIPFWQDIVTYFKSYPMVGYDLYNEPHWANASTSADWLEWLNGGATVTDSNGNTYQEVGYRQMVQAVRAISPSQPIVLEPGNASGNGDSSEGGWANYPSSDLIQAPNLIYSEHEYSSVSQSLSYQKQRWGILLGKYPIIYGEWAVLPNPNKPNLCKGISPSNADQIANSFMSNAAAIGANWTAWEFDIPHEIVNMTSYTPTQMGPGTNWTCPAPTSEAVGMGQDVKDFLASFKQPGPTPSPNPSSSPSPSPSPNPSNSGGTSSLSGNNSHGSSSADGNTSNNHPDTGLQAIADKIGIPGTWINAGPVTMFYAHATPTEWMATIIAGAAAIGGGSYLYISGAHLAALHFIRLKTGYLMMAVRRLIVRR